MSRSGTTAPRQSQRRFVYYGSRCDDSANDNSFHDNTVYDNGAIALLISNLHNDAAATRLTSRTTSSSGGPTRMGRSWRSSSTRASIRGPWTGMSSTCRRQSSTPGLFRWLVQRLPTPPDTEIRYSFDQFSRPGGQAGHDGRPEPSCGSPTTIELDERSKWVDPGIVAPGPPAAPR